MRKKKHVPSKTQACARALLGGNDTDSLQCLLEKIVNDLKRRDSNISERVWGLDQAPKGEKRQMHAYYLARR